jgi:hypothetical protein
MSDDSRTGKVTGAGSQLPWWVLPGGIGLLLAVGALMLWVTTPAKPLAALPAPSGKVSTASAPSPASQEYKLNVFVRPPIRATEPLPVEEKGALPVSQGWIMSLQAVLPAPAYTYFVWLDCTGQAIPLYPWNTRELEFKDIGQPPPVRQPTKTVYSPLLGGGWTFGERGGMETVLVMSRSTPLPEGTSVGELLGELPPPVAVREPTELVIFEVKDYAKTVTSVVSQARGDEGAAKAADEPLKALLLRLSPHFDLVRAVRFAHVAGESGVGDRESGSR